MVLAQFVASKPLTSLLKSDCGICSIVAGNIFRCMLCEVRVRCPSINFWVVLLYGYATMVRL